MTRRLRRYLLVIVISSMQLAVANESKDIVDAICDQIFNKSESVNFADLFSGVSVANAIESDLAPVLHDVGSCETIDVVDNKAGSFSAVIKTDLGNIVIADYTIDSCGRISSLAIKDINYSHIHISDLSSMIAHLNLPNVTTSLTIDRFTGAREQWHGHQSMPLASAFRLYVLGVLVDEAHKGRFNFSEKYPLTNAWKSYPAGLMETHNHADHILLTDLVVHMMKRDDNTATDHLIHMLGREKIGARFGVERGFPFITTAEMIKLRWIAEDTLVKKFLISSHAERVTILNDDVFLLPLHRQSASSQVSTRTNYIRDLDWFSSTNQLCDEMKNVLSQPNSEAREILSHETPFVVAGEDKAFRYAGYLGSASFGVMTMTYLLENQNQEVSSVSMAWSDDKGPINEFLFRDIMRKILRSLEENA